MRRLKLFILEEEISFLSEKKLDMKAFLYLRLPFTCTVLTLQEDLTSITVYPFLSYLLTDGEINLLWGKKEEFIYNLKRNGGGNKFVRFTDVN